MNTDLWQLFVDAAELGSLSKTAQAHNSTQPAVSSKISQLESLCGTRLFERTGRGVVLTETGRILLPRIRRWLSETEELHNDIQSLTGQPVGSIRLGAMPSTIRVLVMPLYKHLKAQYPLIRLKIHEGQGAQLEQGLEEGQLDLALLLRHQEKLAAGDIYLSKVPTYLVSYRGDPLLDKGETAFADIDGLPIATFCRPNSWRTALDHRLAGEHGIRLNVICEADSLDMQAQIAADGQAYALLGAAALAAIKDRYPIAVARIVRPDVSHYLVIGMSRQGKLSQAGKIVIDTIKTLAEQLAQEKHRP